jgi:crossover junction endodeoxyribonuclease RuvC
LKLLGLDPGLRRTGWGIIRVDGLRLSHVANGTVVPPDDRPMGERLAALHDGLSAVIAAHAPDEAAVEAVFVNKNPESTLKLGMARGVVMLTPARLGLSVAEYAPNQIKKSIVGAGHAEKTQIQLMVRTLLPGCKIASADAADALAVAICHAHHRSSPAYRQVVQTAVGTRP